MTAQEQIEIRQVAQVLAEVREDVKALRRETVADRESHRSAISELNTRFVACQKASRVRREDGQVHSADVERATAKAGRWQELFAAAFVGGVATWAAGFLLTRLLR